jgi:hypothetical protein
MPADFLQRRRAVAMDHPAVLSLHNVHAVTTCGMKRRMLHDLDGAMPQAQDALSLQCPQTFGDAWASSIKEP